MGKTEGRSFREIAVCLGRYYEETNAKFLKILCDRAADNGIRVVIYATCSDLKDMSTYDRGEEKVFDYLMIRRYDAIVVLPETFGNSEKYKEIVEYADRADIPLISVNRKIDGCYNIIYDYGNSFEKIVRHVIEFHGAKKVCFIAGMKDNPFSEERLERFRKVLKEHGLKCDESHVGYGDFWEGPAAEIAERFMKDPEGAPEAIICANDTMAIAACGRLKELGFRIPEDVIVTGFDGIDMSGMYSPRITTAKLNIRGIVEDIFAIVDSIGRPDSKKEYLIEHDMCSLQSCGCAGPLNAENFGNILYDMVCDRNRALFICNESCKMLTRLSRPQKLQELLDEFLRVLSNGSVSYVVLCTEEDMISPYFNFTNCAVTKDVPGFLYVPLIKNRQHIESSEIIGSADIVPDYGSVMKKRGNLIILPMHAEEICVGYAACSFDDNDFSYGQYQWLFMNFMQALNNYRTKQEIEDLYSRDYLTGLYSRRGFYNGIERVLKECSEWKRPFTVISFDMDGLKKINDNFGHEAGDFALKSIGDAITGVLDNEKYAARTGGDEFLIAFAGNIGESEEMSVKKAEAIISDMRKHLAEISRQKPYDVGVSCGIKTMIPKGGTRIDEYLKASDAKLYIEKHMHRKLSVAGIRRR